MRQPYPETKVRITDQWNIPHYQDPCNVSYCYYQPIGRTTKEVLVIDTISKTEQIFKSGKDVAVAFGWGIGTPSLAIGCNRLVFGRYLLKYTGRKI